MKPSSCEWELADEARWSAEHAGLMDDAAVRLLGGSTQHAERKLRVVYEAVAATARHEPRGEARLQRWLGAILSEFMPGETAERKAREWPERFALHASGIRYAVVARRLGRDPKSVRRSLWLAAETLRTLIAGGYGVAALELVGDAMRQGASHAE